jgi:hypothetical protein
MADDANDLPPSRVVRWMLLGGAILVAVGLYFRSGRNVPPVSAPAAAVEPAPSPITR